MPPNQITTGRVLRRLDGFVSLDAVPIVATVETVPLGIDGHRLEVNVDASSRVLGVEALSVYGAELPGFDVASSEGVGGHPVRHTVTWDNWNPLDTSKPIRFRLSGQCATLQPLHPRSQCDELEAERDSSSGKVRCNSRHR